MQLGKVIGRAVSSVKHPSLKGWRLLIVQPLDPRKQPDGAPQLVLDRYGAAPGSEVLMTSDGKSTREMVGADTAPARWAILGLVD